MMMTCLFCCRFSKRVSRAFSFNKTPRKLKRAISSMTQMSPFHRRDSTQSLYTPSSSAAAANGATDASGALLRSRLASYNDLTVSPLSLCGLSRDVGAFVTCGSQLVVLA